ncbi:MAG: TonB family protein [Bacteroidota bacterium]|nr:TonB family protein [Bacteroidota bacterium]
MKTNKQQLPIVYGDSVLYPMMKKALTILFMMLPFITYGQDTTYYNSDWKKVKSIKKAVYYKVLEVDKNDPNRVTERTYDLMNQLLEEIPYSNYAKETRDGTCRKWYNNGQLKHSIDYKEGKLNGKILCFYEDGKPSRIDSFEDDKLVNGKIFNRNGIEVPHFDFIIMPTFPGGINGLMQYVSSSLRYPFFSLSRGIEGTVIVKYCIKKDGRVSSVKVIQGVYDDLDQEAKRVIKNMPKWKPGLEDGELTDYWYTQPIVFRLRHP